MDIAAVLARHPVYGRLRNEALTALLRASNSVRLRRTEPLWRNGEPATHFHLVAQGLIAVCGPCGHAREVLLGFAGQGDGVGEAAALVGGSHPNDAHGFATPTVVVRIPRDLVLDLMERSGTTAIAYAMRLAELRNNAERRLQSFTRTSDARLAELLLALCARFGEDADLGARLIPLKITRAQLASMVGTTVETVIRTASKWAREGTIATLDHGILVHDPEALARIADVPLDQLPRLADLTRIA